VSFNASASEWTGKVAGAWSGINSQGKHQHGIFFYFDTDFDGKDKSAALTDAFGRMQMRAGVFDLKGIRNVTWTGLTGDCWRGEKPRAPVGWFKHLEW
jgi:hypothetical protein